MADAIGNFAGIFLTETAAENASYSSAQMARLETKTS
jgi:hypothetical protein